MAEKTRERIVSRLDGEMSEFRTARDLAIKELRDKLDMFSDALTNMLDELEKRPGGMGDEHVLSDQFSILGDLYSSAIRKTASATGFFSCLEAYKIFSE